MRIFSLIRKESQTSFRTLFAMAALSGLANALLLAVINHLIDHTRPHDEDLEFVGVFFLCVLLFYYTKKYILRRSTTLVEKVVSKLRLRIADKLRKSEVELVEGLGSANIYARITQDANLISQSAAYVINACQSLIMIAASIAYLAYQSFSAFFIVSTAIALGYVYYMNRQKQISRDIRAMFARETEFFATLDELLSGIKELKLHHRKNEGLFREFTALADETEAIKIRTGFHYVHNMTFSQMFFYLLIGTVAVALPILSGQAGASIKIVTALLFIIGPIETIVGSMQIFAKANVAARNIEKLEGTLAASTAQFWPEDPLHVPALGFENSLRLRAVQFDYNAPEGQASFGVGPLDLEIRKGETLFIIGGNGSGKSTLLKLLAGLYVPHSGTIAVDGHAVAPADYPRYRELFSAIFTDFHLFTTLYGIENPDPERFARLLRAMELDHKTSFAAGRFTDLHLSTGQRKRLAIIAAIVEDKDVLLFDEAAADQDPRFKRYFYETLLPDLQGLGKTIIAISHDDHYFHAADRIVKLEYGTIVDSGV